MLTVLLPRHTPPLSLMLADLGHPEPADLARVLGCSRATVYRWRRTDRAPRVVLLALFWATRWGRSEVECRAVNDARLQAQRAQSFQTTAEQRLQEVEHLLRIGAYGAANGPLLSYSVPGMALPAAEAAEALRSDTRSATPRPLPLEGLLHRSSSSR